MVKYGNLVARFDETLSLSQMKDIIVKCQYIQLVELATLYDHLKAGKYQKYLDKPTLVYVVSKDRKFGHVGYIEGSKRIDINLVLDAIESELVRNDDE
jgi:hypothetical protein